MKGLAACPFCKRKDNIVILDSSKEDDVEILDKKETKDLWNRSRKK